MLPVFEHLLWADHFGTLTPLTFTTTQKATLLCYSGVQMRKLRFRNGEYLTQDHKTNEEQSQGLNLGQLILKPVLYVLSYAVSTVF